MPPHFFHQNTASRLHVLLANWSELTGLGSVVEKPGLVFGPNDAVIPDLIWMSSDRLPHALDQVGHLTVAPGLVIEILSPGEINIQRDKTFKRKFYSIHGVQKYWILNWQ